MAAVAPAIIGVSGTLAGGILSSLITLWLGRTGYERALALDVQKAALARRESAIAQRQALYTEWVAITERLLDEIWRADAFSGVTGELVRARAAIALTGHEDVRDAVAKEFDAWSRLDATLMDREKDMRQVLATHADTLSAMRRAFSESSVERG